MYEIFSRASFHSMVTDLLKAYNFNFSQKYVFPTSPVQIIFSENVY